MIHLARDCTWPLTSGPPINPSDELSAQQSKAMVALLAGCTSAEAAQQAGVHRNTVYHWRSRDRAFQQALCHGQQELRQAVEAQLLAMAGDAANCIERAITLGDARIAMQLLKGLAFLACRAPQPPIDSPQDEHEEAGAHTSFAWR